MDNLLIALDKVLTFQDSLAMNSRFVQLPHNLKDKKIRCAWGKKKKREKKSVSFGNALNQLHFLLCLKCNNGNWY